MANNHDEICQIDPECCIDGRSLRPVFGKTHVCLGRDQGVVPRRRARLLDISKIDSANGNARSFMEIRREDDAGEFPRSIAPEWTNPSSLFGLPDCVNGLLYRNELRRRFGLDQDFEGLRSGYARVSAEYGDVFAFWCNDASDTYMISIFRNGRRIRFWAMGPGLDENHGERLSFEPECNGRGDDHLMASLEAVAGCPLVNSWNLPMERFA